MQLNLKQYGFELHESTYMWIFLSKYIWKFGGDLWQFEKTFL